MNLNVFLCFALPVIWILGALFAHRMFVRRGYPQSESWLPGCLLGPLGVIMAILVPRGSSRVRYVLEFAGLFFALTVLNGSLLALLRLAARGLSQLGLGLFIVCEVALFFIVRRRIPKYR